MTEVIKYNVPDVIQINSVDTGINSMDVLTIENEFSLIVGYNNGKLSIFKDFKSEKYSKILYPFVNVSNKKIEESNCCPDGILFLKIFGNYIFISTKKNNILILEYDKLSNSIKTKLNLISKIYENKKLTYDYFNEKIWDFDIKGGKIENEKLLIVFYDQNGLVLIYIDLNGECSIKKIKMVKEGILNFLCDISLLDVYSTRIIEYSKQLDNQKNDKASKIFIGCQSNFLLSGENWENTNEIIMKNYEGFEGYVRFLYYIEPKIYFADNDNLYELNIKSEKYHCIFGNQKEKFIQTGEIITNLVSDGNWIICTTSINNILVINSSTNTLITKKKVSKNIRFMKFINNKIFIMTTH